MSDRPAQNPDGTLVNPPFAQDFTGMSEAPFSDEARRILAECPKHEDVEVKPEGICYMPGVWYRRQLTRAFGAGAWALKPTGPVRTVGNIIEWPGALYVLGRWVAEAVGGQETSDWMSHADSIQGAKTDCLSKCCGHGLAMASELWDKTWREAWMSEYCESYEHKTKKDKFGRPKVQWRLKEKRQPRAANLMGVPVTGEGTTAATPGASGSSGHATMKPTSAPILSDTGEAAPDADYEAIRSEMKRLKMRKAECLEFLGKHFGVESISALTGVQAKGCLEMLRAG